jgi:lysophospholipase L1-like esterase
MRFIPAFLFLILVSCTTLFGLRSKREGVDFFSAKNKAFRYTGRFDFSNKKLPRCWNPGAYIEANFTGTFLEIEVNDEMLYGGHNYIAVSIDDLPAKRIKLKAHTNVILISDSLADKEHHVMICKDTESGMGYIEFVGISCQVIRPAAAKKKKIEFIGDSITCGNGSDTSEVKCGEGKWYDQHNAYDSFGPLVARAFNADWQLSSVSGIGLTRSCCGLETTMPKVYDKIDFAEDGPKWKFADRDPDVVVITLGQNDGIQDSTDYCASYVAFIFQVRRFYKAATIVCSTSPMANKKLQRQLNSYIPAVTAEMHRRGDLNVHPFLYRNSYRSGCFYHPTLSEHREMAGELMPYLAQLTGWSQGPRAS